MSAQSPLDSSPLLRVDNLAFSFPSQGGRPERVLFKAASLSIFPGDTIGLSADNGVGKTTLLRLMTGLEKRAAGTLTLNGQTIESEADFCALRKTVGFVLQNADHQLFFPDVFDDVAFGPKNLGRSDQEAEADALEALTLLGAEHLAREESFHLSGGQKRLVTIASILAMKPAILLLDEPTTGLDARSVERLITVLKGLPQAKLIVSHDADFLRAVCNRHLTIEDGCLVEK